MMSVREALAVAGQRLVQAGVTDARQEAAWLLAHVLGASVGALRLRETESLSQQAHETFQGLIKRRESREPIQYILGTEEFMGLTFRVTPAVLIPRLDTEVLVREVAGRLYGPVQVADVGTGSGAIAVALATLLPEATIIGVDISPEALAVAWENAAANGVLERVSLRQGDLLEPCRAEAFDAIVSNPPYIDEPEWAELMPEVRLYEPRLALTPGADGLAFYRRLAAEGPSLLKPGGLLAVEVGYQQAAAVRTLFEQAGLQSVTVQADLAGIDRVVVGTRK